MVVHLNQEQLKISRQALLEHVKGLSEKKSIPLEGIYFLLILLATDLPAVREMNKQLEGDHPQLSSAQHKA
jgi:hypothetical protein